MKHRRPPMLDTSLSYLKTGLSVLPARLSEKRPAISTWKEYQTRTATEQEIRGWFNNSVDAVCVLCGKVSGNMEMVDFDFKGEWFEAWHELVRQNGDTVLGKVYIETSQSGGCHVAYCCEAPVSGNDKLAQRRICVPGPGEYVYEGAGKPRPKQGDEKALKAFCEAGRWVIYPCLIETRGDDVPPIFRAI